MTSIETSKAAAKAARGPVGEFITEDRVDALNACLVERGVEASQIIAIFALPAQPVANAAPPRFRVLYRKG